MDGVHQSIVLSVQSCECLVLSGKCCKGVLDVSTVLPNNTHLDCLHRGVALGLWGVFKELPVVIVVVVGDLKVSPVVQGLRSIGGCRPGGKVDKPIPDVESFLVLSLLAVDVVDATDVEVAHVPEDLLLGDPLTSPVFPEGVGDIDDHLRLVLVSVGSRHGFVSRIG